MFIYHTMVEGTLFLRRRMSDVVIDVFPRDGGFFCCGVERQDVRMRVGCAEVCDRLLFSNPIRSPVDIVSTVLPTESLKISEVFIALGLASLFLTQRPPVGQGLLIHEVSRSHTTTHRSQ